MQSAQFMSPLIYSHGKFHADTTVKVKSLLIHLRPRTWHAFQFLAYYRFNKNIFRAVFGINSIGQNADVYL